MPEPLKLADIKLRMQAYGVKPSKRLGQNFLADFNLLRAIVADAEVGRADCVLEIGTGAGSLTGLLCDAAGLVITVEVDRGMFQLSRDILSGVENLIQVRCDALNAPGRGLNPALVDLVAKAVSGNAAGASSNDEFEVAYQRQGAGIPHARRLKLVANLPYSVATSLIIAALESALPFEHMLVMVQHEVGEKLAARPGDREWGLPALLRSQFADARMKRKVPAAVFWPRPKVDSALIELRPTAKPDMPAYHRLRRLAHVLFQHRRKSSSNALAMALGVPNSQAAEWIKASGGDPGHRAEQLDPAVLQRLADHREVEPQVRMAMQQHESQLSAKADKKARRAEWKSRVYGDE